MGWDLFFLGGGNLCNHPAVVEASQKAEETGRCGHHQSLELERAEGPEPVMGLDLKVMSKCYLVGLLGFLFGMVSDVSFGIFWRWVETSNFKCLVLGQQLFGSEIKAYLAPFKQCRPPD